MKKNTLVVIPAYNEERSIRQVVEGAARFADVCVVNDHSRDRTGEIARSIPGVTCITHERNTHIPRAILDGMRYGFDRGYEYIVTMDAGLSHDPAELPRFLGAPDSDLVLGVRTDKKNSPLYRRALSYAARVLVILALRPIRSGLPRPGFRDVTSGYRRYSRRAVGVLLNRDMKARTFDFHTEALMLVYRNGLSFAEVPITYNFSNSSLNLKVVKDGIRMFLDMMVSRRK